MLAEWQRGDRVELVRTTDLFTRLRPGDRGTVRSIDGLGAIHVKWDSGSSLAIVMEAGDRIRRVAS